MPVPRKEFEERIKKVRKRMTEEKLDALIAYGDTKITGNVRYLSGYSARFGGYVCTSRSEWVTFGRAAVVVPLEGEPTLITDCAFAEKAVRELSVLENLKFSTDFKDIADLLKKNQKGRIGISTWDRFPHSMYAALKERLPKATLLPSFIVEDLRMVKSPAEIEILRKAAEVADEGVGVAIKALAEGKSEKEIHEAAENAMELRNPSPRFVEPTNILSFGVRTALGGPYPSGAKLRKGDMVMMDVCNEYDGYAGDITRMKVFGTPTRDQRELYELNLQMDEKAINAIRPGAKARDIWDAAVKVAREAGYEKYVRPCVSHGIGLDVAEKPGHNGVDETRLVPNMVLTCEPAICTTNLGSSIEDMVLVTETGRELLTKYEKSLEL